MDLASGYNQVSVVEADRPKTAFCTPFGLFEWLLYVDDIVVFSSAIEQHLERLVVVLGWLQQEGLKEKTDKCAFFQREVRYLGHVISGKSASTDPSKIANWQPPSTMSELQLFLGFACFYSWWPLFISWSQSAET